MPEDSPVASRREELNHLFEALAGQQAPLGTDAIEHVLPLLESGRGLGYSQFNEVLLLLGYDRVTHAFFQFLINATTEYAPGSAIRTIDELREGVDRFRKLALVLFGNVKFAFKRLSRDASELELWLDALEPIDDSVYQKRHDPVHPLRHIDPADTYYLGYVVQAELRSRLDANPNDAQALAEESKRKEVVDAGASNHHAYLASDHIDVYVATSMRERHEYLQISELGRSIFGHPSIRDLKLRWFDPTQAYCEDRIDKGLAEALMLKRAKCTLYLAQETDTLGKDSELASTLAQGKPVIAFLPVVDEGYVERLLLSLRAIYPSASDVDLLLQQLQIFDARAAWANASLRRWIDDPVSAPITEVTSTVEATMRAHYDKRAKLLREAHPLGIQVNLATGVANGVLVVRTVDECAQLIRSIVTNRLDFYLETKTLGGREYLLLRESISKSIFRVVTGDAMLTNTFWNFYLEPAE